MEIHLKTILRQILKKSINRLSLNSTSILKHQSHLLINICYTKIMIILGHSVILLLVMFYYQTKLGVSSR